MSQPQPQPQSQSQPHPHREWNTSSRHAHRNEQSNSYRHYRAGGGHRHDLRRVVAAQIMGLWNAIALVIRPLLTWITEMLDAVLLLVEYIWEMVEDIQAVASVRVFVTGYWEVTEPRKLCLGPIRNSYPNIIPGDQLYVIIKEVEVIAKHSFWPPLEADNSNVPLDNASTAEYNIIPDQRPPPEFLGQLQHAGGVQRLTYYLLLFSRALCFPFVWAAECILPPRRRVFLDSHFDLWAVPTADQIEEAEAHVEASEMKPWWFEPFAPDLIRGTRALEAARRAGFRHEI